MGVTFLLKNGKFLRLSKKQNIKSLDCLKILRSSLSIKSKVDCKIYLDIKGWSNIDCSNFLRFEFKFISGQFLLKRYLALENFFDVRRDQSNNLSCAFSIHWATVEIVKFYWESCIVIIIIATGASRIYYSVPYTSTLLIINEFAIKIIVSTDFKSNWVAILLSQCRWKCH